ncbi:MAG: LptE family protein [Bacteroidales bacterium]|nr:LptE family protein [Bacteroidales bacterium]MDZ4203991.1 LptE family protein [Bacteroidales bacterium]
MVSIFKNRRVGLYLLAAISMAWMAGCGVYSFTGASVPPEAKTISIQTFRNNAPLIQPSLSQTFSDALRDKFMSQTSLSMVQRAGDLAIEGAITDYSTQPIAITGDQTAALNRLTITVKVKFTNRFDEKQGFEENFSRFEDYASNLALSAVEEGLIAQITEALVQDIFNRAVVNW